MVSLVANISSSVVSSTLCSHVGLKPIFHGHYVAYCFHGRSYSSGESFKINIDLRVIK